MSRLRQLKNNAFSTIANVGGIAAGAASLNVQPGDGDAKFPATAGSQFFPVRLWDPTNNVYASAEIAWATSSGTLAETSQPRMKNAADHPAGDIRRQHDCLVTQALAVRSHGTLMEGVPVKTAPAATPPAGGSARC